MQPPFGEVMHAVSIALLRFVRDEAPTQGQLLEWLGQSQAGRFHVLHKAGLFVVENELVAINPTHRRGDLVVWHSRDNSVAWNLDTGRMDTYSAHGQPGF